MSEWEGEKPTREEMHAAAEVLAELAACTVMGLNNPLALLLDDRAVLSLGAQSAALLKAALLAPEWAGAIVAKIEAFDRFRPDDTATITLEEGARQILRLVPVSMVVEP